MMWRVRENEAHVQQLNANPRPPPIFLYICEYCCHEQLKYFSLIFRLADDDDDDDEKATLREFLWKVFN